ncbi:putative membrane protein [Rhizomicrobium palustre]|uniref:Putative membrane protein n=1 Tax=Rhizomicrobium palustre TaxID=189966 RepID=A0A846MUZ5_9PROT|nr:SdpI family protein [Rhizomicrobium palustre]NIK87348.1 putative membrane protein [Rhizomicrobium palustre]
METRAPLILSLALILGMIAISLWAWPHLSPNGLIAIHFGQHGQANGFARREVALFWAPLLALGLTIVFALYAHSQSNHQTAYQGAFITAWLGAVTAVFVGHCIVVFAARGFHPAIAGTGVLVPALLLTVLGNSLGKTRPNPLIGVRTPWTKKSDLAWDKTNRLAGRLCVATGLASLAALAAGGPLIGHGVLLSGVVIMTALCIPLSRHYWRRDPNRRM